MPSDILPIDALLPQILASLRAGPNLVIEAAPGAGKTTRVPPALLGLVAGEVIVLEPRRIAARLAARRVAAELGEEVGGTVGYQVRFEDVTSARTRLRFVTEGILTRRLLSDPTLRGVDAVILDEFHERHLDSDLALALLKRLQQTRPELRLIVMSATLDAGPIATYLACPTLRSEGRAYPLAVRHLPYSPDPLPRQVRTAVDMLLRERHTGSILAFLPGIAEIHRTARECASINGLLVLPLHGDLTPAEQDRAVAPSAQPKLILATNVAESSVTVEGVTAVIDSGLARTATYSPWTGLPTLTIGRISQASATQRAGRAGRTAPGQVLRLYPEADFAQRTAHDTPEILRSDLSQLALALRVLEIPITELHWLDAPPAGAVEQAVALLNQLGASGTMAKKLARFPLPPRLARVLAEAETRGVAHDACLAAALLSSGTRNTSADLLEQMDLPPDARTAQTAAQLRRLTRATGPATHNDDQLLLSLLTGFPDRVARRRAGPQVLLASGLSAELTGEAPPYEFLLALDAEDRPDKPLPLIRTTTRVEAEWLLDLFPERIREQASITWNRLAERVEATSTLLYDQLPIEETANARPDPIAAANLLAEKVLEAGIARFTDAEALENLLARIAFAGLPAPHLDEAIRDLCTGLRSFAELEQAAKHLLPLLEQSTDSRRLQEHAPTTLRLQAGRQTEVHYDQGKPPWIASRLQDFFGMRETPRIGPGRSPVVIHLLAPNQRAVQTTTDLAGFWQRLYPEVRRELMRRYPRHQWPEKP